MTRQPRLDPKTGEPLHAFGYDLDQSGAPIREPLKPIKPGQDYGADPIGDGTFRMVPSGDVVDHTERNRRLSRYGVTS